MYTSEGKREKWKRGGKGWRDIGTPISRGRQDEEEEEEEEEKSPLRRLL